MDESLIGHGSCNHAELTDSYGDIDPEVVGLLQPVDRKLVSGNARRER